LPLKSSMFAPPKDASRTSKPCHNRRGQGGVALLSNSKWLLRGVGFASA
jgi:hypothetical protein